MRLLKQKRKSLKKFNHFKGFYRGILWHSIEMKEEKSQELEQKRPPRLITASGANKFFAKGNVRFLERMR
jgi:hypothetical protein